MKKSILIPISLFITLLAVGFIASQTEKRQSDEIKEKGKQAYIVSTTSQIGDLIQNIVGQNAKTDYLMGSGIDPHMYHPTRSDVSKLLQADIVFYNGMNLEGKMEHFLENLQSKKQTISVANTLDPKALQKINGEENYDPHIWMDVKNWITASKEITDILSTHSPQNADTYKINNKSYIRKLQKLDLYAKTAIASIPKEKRIMITAHDAFGYLGAAYDIEVMGIQGISTESEAGIGQIKEIVDMVISRKIPAIFVETSVGGHNINAIIEGARAQGHDLKIGGKLYSDAMGTPGSAESTYIGMMAHNIKTITTALGGTVKDFDVSNME